MDSNQEKAAKQQELLLGNQAAQARMEAKMDANQEKMGSNQEKEEARMVKFEEKMDNYQKKRMAMLDAHHKSIEAYLGQTEANIEKIVPDPEATHSVDEHQEVQ
jgi:hypothetical protein